jgi:hypothetical protein
MGQRYWALVKKSACLDPPVNVEVRVGIEEANIAAVRTKKAVSYDVDVAILAAAGKR